MAAASLGKDVITPPAHKARSPDIVIRTGFNHGGRSAVDKGEKVQTKAKSNQ